MAAYLLPCPSCFRHVLSTERACPFCGAELAVAVGVGRVVVAETGNVGRALSRAAIALAGAAAIAGCGKELKPPPDAGEIQAFPPYGQVFVDPVDAGIAVPLPTPPDIDAAPVAPPERKGRKPK